MIQSTQQTFYRLNNLNTEHERINYQLSTGKKLQYGSDDSNTYIREVYIEDRIRVYEGIQAQLERTTTQNNGADTTLADAKDLVAYVKAEVIKALNATTDDDGKQAIASNIEGIKENLLSLANEQIEDDYLFAGSDSSIKPFVEDETTGRISYQGDNQLRKVVVEDATYRERGVNGFETFLYTASSALRGDTLEFSVDDRVIDQDGSEWKLGATSTVASSGTLTFSETNAIVDQDGTVWTLNNESSALTDGFGNTLSITDLGTIPATFTVTVPNSTGAETLGVVDQLIEYDTDGNITGETLTVSGDAPDNLTVDVLDTNGAKLEAKSNIFDLLDNIINALEKVDSDGNTLSDEDAQTALQATLDEVSLSYEGMNVGHAKLGGRNQAFEISYERVSSKVFQYEKLQLEVSSVDLAEVATEAKALELTYSALYSTINRMNELSLVNFLK